MTLAGTLPKYDGIFFEVICHSTIVYQVNLACLRDGVAVLGLTGGDYGTVFQSKFNNLFIMVWSCMVFIHSTSVYILHLSK